MAPMVDTSRNLWVKEWILGIYIAAVKVLGGRRVSMLCMCQAKILIKGDQKERIARSH